MEAVAAFGLVVGILQVLDYSFKAVSQAREIAKNGSLTQHRDTEEVVKELDVTTQNLATSIQKNSTNLSKESQDVLDISRKCIGTSNELLAELKKLQAAPGDSRFENLKLSIRILKRRKLIVEMEQRLKEYRDLLNTRILSKLDFHAVRQAESFENLEQSTKGLAIALSQGHRTVEELLANQTKVLQDYRDRQVERQAQGAAKQKAIQKFKESLFFSDIFTRQEEISTSYEGTCRWIFGPPSSFQSRSSSFRSDESSGHASSDKASVQNDEVAPSDEVSNPGDENKIASEGYSENTGRRDENALILKEGNKSESEATPRYIKRENDPPWSNFVRWLQNGTEAYWLSGKPGSGKSTLMKYISNEIQSVCQSDQKLIDWIEGNDLIVCSFFFWNLGGPLQKNYVGFLRALLYQIAQNNSAAEILLESQGSTNNEAFTPVWTSDTVHTWTEKRLSDAFHYFILRKSASLRMIFLIDGLDEFEGEEESLLKTIQSVIQDPYCRVCVSSRPEEIFRQGFAGSPQLKLQDLNYEDIYRMVDGRLRPRLTEFFPSCYLKCQDLIEGVISKSQGIFLWAELTSKTIQQHTRNRDTLEELHQLLEGTPDTINGLYQAMISRLDSAYLKDMAKYCEMLQKFEDRLGARWSEHWCYHLRVSLLYIACLKKPVLRHLSNKDFGYFESEEFKDLCNRLETRILTRCAGLVEIHKAEKTMPRLIFETFDDRYVPEMKVGGVANTCREIQFIHRTAAEFIVNTGILGELTDSQSGTDLAETRSRMYMISLLPQMLRDDISSWLPLRLNLNMTILPLVYYILKAEESHSCKKDNCLFCNEMCNTVDLIWDTAKYVHTRLNGSQDPFPSFSKGRPDVDARWALPFHDCLGFAAFCGLHQYLQYRAPSNEHLVSKADYLVDCSIGALIPLCNTYPETRPEKEDLLRMFTGLCRVITRFLPLCQKEEVIFGNRLSDDDHAKKDSKWSVFISRSLHLLNKFDPRGLEVGPRLLFAWKETFRCFLLQGADANLRLSSFWDVSAYIPYQRVLRALINIQGHLLAHVHLVQSFNKDDIEELTFLLDKAVTLDSLRFGNVWLRRYSDDSSFRLTLNQAQSRRLLRTLRRVQYLQQLPDYSQLTHDALRFLGDCKYYEVDSHDTKYLEKEWGLLEFKPPETFDLDEVLHMLCDELYGDYLSDSDSE